MKIQMLNSIGYNTKGNKMISGYCDEIDLLLDITRNIQIHTCRVVNKKMIKENDLNSNPNFLWKSEDGSEDITNYYRWDGKSQKYSQKRSKK